MFFLVVSTFTTVFHSVKCRVQKVLPGYIQLCGFI